MDRAVIFKCAFGVGILVSGLLSGCGGGGGGPKSDPPVISTFVAAPSIVTEGSTSTLSATYTGGTGGVNQGAGALPSGGNLTVTPTQTTSYTLTVTAPSGTTTTRLVQVQVVAPAAVPSVQVAGFATAKTPGLTASVTPQANCTYAWTLTGGTVTGGADTSQVTFTAGDPGTLTLNCVVTNAAGGASAPGHGVVAVVPPPAVPVLKAPALATQDLPLTATATAGQDCTLAWSLNQGSILSGQGTGTIQAKSSFIGDAVLSVRGVNQAGTASDPASAVISIVAMSTINTLTPAAPTLTTGDSVSVTCTFTGSSAQLNPGAIAIANGVPFTLTPAATTKYTVSVFNLAGAEITQDLPVTVVDPPLITSLALNDDKAPLSQGVQVTAVFSGGQAVVNPGGHVIVSGTPLTLFPAGPSLLELQVTNLAGRRAKAQCAYRRQVLGASYMRTYLLKDDGSVLHWGMDLEAIAGSGYKRNSAIPTLRSGLGGSVSLSVLDYSCSVLKADGTVWTVSNYNSDPPKAITGLSHVVAIASGSAHSLALDADGKVWAWGTNKNGELGDGTGFDRTIPISVAGLDGVTAVFAGGGSSFALKADGTVWAWGSNTNGQLGQPTPVAQPRPVQVSGLAGIASLTVGWGEGSALKFDGSVLNWGTLNGNGTTPVAPVPVPGLQGVVGLSANEVLTQALTINGELWSWGSNSSGLYGGGNYVGYHAGLVPIRAVGIDDILLARAGGGVAYAIRKDGTLWSWGSNLTGALGDGFPLYRFAPEPVSLPMVPKTLTSPNGTTLAIGQDGRLWGWGSNSDMALAQGNSPSVERPTLLAMPGPVKKAENDGHESIALLDDGTVWHWGLIHNPDNYSYGTITGSPEQFPTLASVKSISIGIFTKFALRQDGSLWGWGDNLSGNLGDGTTDARSLPVQVLGGQGVAAVAAGDSHTLAIQAGGATPGQVWAWGSNGSGQLGDGGTQDRSLPAPVGALSHMVEVAAGNDFSLALKDDGTVFCWGALPGFKSYTPVPLPGLSGIVAIRAGLHHALALKADGTVWTLGDNPFGQLGRGGGASQTDIAPVPGLTGVTEIAAGGDSSFALGAGFVVAWGSDRDGQLGLGRVVDRPAPAQVPGFKLW